MWLGFYDIPLMFGGRCRRLRRLCRRYLLFTSYLLHTIHHLKLVLIPSASFSHRAIQAVVLQYPLLWKLFNFRSYPAANEADRNKIKIFLQWKNIDDGKGNWCGMCFFPSLGRTLSSSSSSSSLFTVVVWIIAAVAVICSSFNSLQFCIKHGNELFVNGPPFKHASDWTEVIFCSIRDSFIYIQTKKSATYGEKKTECRMNDIKTKMRKTDMEIGSREWKDVDGDRDGKITVKVDNVNSNRKHMGKIALCA